MDIDNYIILLLLSLRYFFINVIGFLLKQLNHEYYWFLYKEYNNVLLL